MITLNTVFPSQLLPKRLDWTGQEHPGTYENLVRESVLPRKKFLESKIKIEFPAIFKSGGKGRKKV